MGLDNKPLNHYKDVVNSEEASQELITEPKPRAKIDYNNTLAQRENVDYVKVTRRVVSRETWRIVVRKAVDQAKEGDRYARDWLTALLIGKDSLPAKLKVVDLGDAVKLEEVRRAVTLAKRLKPATDST